MKSTGLIYFLALGVTLAWGQLTFRIRDMSVTFEPPPSTSERALADLVDISFLVTLPYTDTTFLCQARRSERTALPTLRSYATCFPMNANPNNYVIGQQLQESLSFAMARPFVKLDTRAGRLTDRIKLNLAYEQTGSNREVTWSAKLAVEQQQFRWNIERGGNQVISFERGAYYDYPY